MQSTDARRIVRINSDELMTEGNPQVVVIAGPNGAGKSTLAPFLLRDTFGVLEYVNADPIALGLSAFDSASMSVEAGRIMVARLRDLAKRRKSFAFETTLASRFYAPWMKRLRESGYKFHLVFLWLSSIELAIERVEERVRSGGHSIPDEVIRRRYDRGITNFFNLYQPLADTWAAYDWFGHSLARLGRR
jgi:predicted ABC-type ATPase